MIQPWLQKTDSVIEIGSGPGSVLREFRRAGFNIEGLDIIDGSYASDLRPTVYNGERMPFQDGAYDTALLLTVLHHTHDPDAIINEAKRIARRVIIIEDVFNTAWQRKYTKITDSITNLEFFGHPHTNRSDDEWRETFDRLGLSLVHGEVHRLASLFLQSVYVLEVGERSN